MTKAESSAYLVALWEQSDELHLDLVRRAREERTVSMPEEAVSFNGYLTPSTDLIRAHLDLPTFIARHIGPTPVGFRRVGDLLVCPCPLPDGTGIDDWM
jgi:hypothetical protein